MQCAAVSTVSSDIRLPPQVYKPTSPFTMLPIITNHGKSRIEADFPPTIFCWNPLNIFYEIYFSQIVQGWSNNWTHAENSNI